MVEGSHVLNMHIDIKSMFIHFTGVKLKFTYLCTQIQS